MIHQIYNDNSNIIYLSSSYSPSLEYINLSFAGYAITIFGNTDNGGDVFLYVSISASIQQKYSDENTFILAALFIILIFIPY